MATIMAVTLDNRSKKAGDVQNVFTKYGCIIKVRLGLHEAGDVCADNGLIILQLVGEEEEMRNFEKELNAIENVRAKTMNV